MASNFETVFALLIGHEGGYVNNPRDPGGETKYGISKRSYPHLDIKNLTLDDAKAIYRRDFWDRIRGDELPYSIALVTFDAAVNCGIGMGPRFTQSALRVAADGKIGPLTIKAAQTQNPRDVVVEALALRNVYNADLGNWDDAGLGWSRRLFRLLPQALNLT